MHTDIPNQHQKLVPRVLASQLLENQAWPTKETKKKIELAYSSNLLQNRTKQSTTKPGKTKIILKHKYGNTWITERAIRYSMTSVLLSLSALALSIFWINLPLQVYILFHPLYFLVVVFCQLPKCYCTISTEANDDTWIIMIKFNLNSTDKKKYLSCCLHTFYIHIHEGIQCTTFRTNLGKRLVHTKANKIILILHNPTCYLQWYKRKKTKQVIHMNQGNNILTKCSTHVE